MTEKGSFTFRRVEEDDVALNKSIGSLNERVFPFTHSTDELHWLAGHFKGAPVDFVAIEEGLDFRGYAYVINFFQASFISLLAILPEYHNQGLGTALLAHLREMQGSRPIVLTAFALDSGQEDINLLARRRYFYIKNGYVDQHIPFPSACNHESDVYVNGSYLSYIELTATLDKVRMFFNSLIHYQLDIK